MNNSIKKVAAAALAVAMFAGAAPSQIGNLRLVPAMSLTAYAAEQKVTFTANGTNNGITVSPTMYKFGAFFVNNKGKNVSISSSNYNITKLVLTDKKLYGGHWGDSYLGASAGNVSFSGDTMTVTGINAKTVTIQGNNSYYATISSIDVYYDVPDGYSVTINPGSNMTKTDGSGAASQTGLSGAMTDVVYTADDGYYFPESYSVAEVNGITVTRNSYTQITVSGTPTADAPITLTAPTAKTTPAAPTTAAAVDCTTTANNDGKLTGVTTAMEYKKSDAASWTAGTGSDITGLVPGTYYVRVKATDTTNASGNQTLTIKGFISYTVTFKVVNGKWNDETTADKTATLTGHDGDTLNLTAEQIPAVGTKPDDNYKAGNWDTEPNTTAAITAATTYTYTYVQHEHIFEYNANGATITANCTAAGCGLTTDPTLTIVAPQPATGDTSLKYDGTAKAATLDGSGDFNTATGLTVSADDIIYSGTLSDGTAYTASSTAPTNAGDYTASITVGETATAMVEFSIGKIFPSVQTPTGLKADYGQTLENVSLPTGWTWQSPQTDVGNVGAHLFKADYTPDDTVNYNEIKGVDVTVTVEKVDPVYTEPQAITGLEYSGLAQTLVTPGSTSDGTILYSKDGTDYGEDVPTGVNAGNYTVYWKITGDGNHFDKSPASITGITIASIDPTVGAPTAIEGLVYDGTAHALVTAGTTDGGTLMYKLDDGNYSTDIPTATDARDYTVYYYVEGDDNYDTTQPEQLNVSIARATQNAPVLSHTDETAAGLNDGTISGLTDEMEMCTTGAEDDYAPVKSTELTGLAPGTYYIRYAEKTNYLASPPAVITIADGRMITITFNTDGGTKISPITGAYGSPVTPPADPTREGFTFMGWSRDIPATMPADDLVIMAMWKPDDSYHPTPSYGQGVPTTKSELNGETPASGTSSTPDNAYYTPDNDVYYESPSTTTAKGMHAEYDGGINIKLWWDEAEYAAEYTVSIVEGGKETVIGTTGETEYTFDKAVPDRTYKFRVRHSTKYGLSNASESYSMIVRTRANKPIVKATVKDGKVKLVWNKVVNAEKYEVCRVNSKGKLTKIGETAYTHCTITPKSTDKGYAVKALVNGKWTKVTKADIAAAE